MRIIREGDEESVYWQGECVRCNAIVRWENNEIELLPNNKSPIELEQDEKFPYKMKVSPSFSIIIEKDCPCCGFPKGIVVTRRVRLPGTQSF